MKIAIDAMGGDFAPINVIEGVKLALASQSRVEKIYLTGQEDRVKEEVDRQKIDSHKIEIVPASEVVEMNESPAKAIRSKKDNSISVAVDLVKRGDADAFLSAGNTGAAVAASQLKLRTLPGVDRPGICSPMPSDHGTCNLIDAGANVEAKARHLLQYGIMGSVYSREIFGQKSPQIGLMSVGTEEEKGTDFTREVYALLKDSHINFVGNIEGHDLFQSKIDVVVCDGFTGNVILKSCEATAKVMMAWTKKELMKNPIRMFGAWLNRNAFRTLKKRSSYETYGGSPLLGVNGITIIAHGSSSPIAIENAIRVAGEAVTQRVNPRIEEEIGRSAAKFSSD